MNGRRALPEVGLMRAWFRGRTLGLGSARRLKAECLDEVGRRSGIRASAGKGPPKSGEELGTKPWRRDWLARLPQCQWRTELQKNLLEVAFARRGCGQHLGTLQQRLLAASALLMQALFWYSVRTHHTAARVVEGSCGSVLFSACCPRPVVATGPSLADGG